MELVLGDEPCAGLRCPTLTLTGLVLGQVHLTNLLVPHLCRLLVDLLMMAGQQKFPNAVKIFTFKNLYSCSRVVKTVQTKPSCRAQCRCSWTWGNYCSLTECYWSVSRLLPSALRLLMPGLGSRSCVAIETRHGNLPCGF